MQVSLKRLHSPRMFYGFVADAMRNLGDIRAAHRNGRVSKAFSERIMLAVTQVNGCRYCSYYHGKLALQAGMSPAEIERLLGGDLGDAPSSELVALLFAQHYAETNARPEPTAVAQLTRTYGAATSRDILAYIRMITIGNVYGNAFDALQQRLHLRPVPGSSLGREIGIVLGAFVVTPVLLARQGVAGLLGRHGRGPTISVP